MSNLQLFVACVAIWGSTWIAITFQLGKVAPEASVFYRFLLASLLVFAYCAARRLPLRHAPREHAWIALFGILMFSVSYIFVYYAEEHIVSGLVAVGYSASPLLGMLGMRMFFGTPMTWRLTAGSVLGIAGIALVFWPEFGKLQAGSETMLGAAFTAGAVLLSWLGNMVAHRNQQEHFPLWQSLAWGMFYSALFSLAYLLVAGKSLAFDATAAYVLSLLYLAVFGFCLARRLPLRYSLREHLWIALLGVLMFSVSYIFVYYAEEHVVSGLVAVGYSASPMLGLIGMRVFFGTPMTRLLVLGSILGMVGIALVFWPEFAKLQGDRDTALGAMHTIIAVVVSAFGAVVAQRNQRANLPLWQSLAWGMFYGALFSLGVTLATGQPLTFEATLPYVLSLLYLAVLGSILAFAAYLTLLHRVGAARAGYIGVMVPIVALVISAAFEGFRWHALTWAGIAVSVAGNVIVLRRK